VPVFIKILKSQGHKLTIFDIEQPRAASIANENGCEVASSIPELIRFSDTVLICTPIQTIPEIIETAFNCVEKNVSLVEISSIKSRTIVKLKSSPPHVRPLCVHPMFGPDVESFEGTTVIVMPVNDDQREVEYAQKLFKGAKIKVLDFEKHDKSMALILSLPYFMNSAFVKCIEEEQLILLKEIAGPTFKTQLALSECIIGEDPLLVQSLIEDNLYAREVLSHFIDELKYLRRMLKKTPRMLTAYYDKSLEQLKKDPDLLNARKIRDEFIQARQVDQY
jgi:prephenate dehydrogenase